MIWFTADTHFGHESIIRYCERPYKTVEEMDLALIDNWNKRVKEEDDVYVLGDFTLKKKISDVTWYINRLNGMKLFIPGCHDRWIDRVSYRLNDVEILDPLFILHTGGYECPVITLCHYAMRTWPVSHYNSWQLYGHSHGRLEGVGKQMDVGVDACGYAPISIVEVARIMEKRPDNFNLLNK